MKNQNYHFLKNEIRKIYSFRYDKKLVIRHDNPPPPHIFKLNIYFCDIFFRYVRMCTIN